MDIGTIAISGVVRGFIFGFFRQILNIPKWLCPHGLYLKLTKIKRYRELFIAEIESYFPYCKDEECYFCYYDKFKQIEQILEKFNFLNLFRYKSETEYTYDMEGYVIDSDERNERYCISLVDLDKIKEQIRKGLYDEKILDYFKTKAER